MWTFLTTQNFFSWRLTSTSRRVALSWDFFPLIRANPIIQIQWHLTIFLIQIYFPVNKSGNAGEETLTFFSRFAVNRCKKSCRKRSLVWNFYFCLYFLLKKNRRCNAGIFSMQRCQVKKIDNIEITSFNAAATLPSNSNKNDDEKKKKHIPCCLPDLKSASGFTNSWIFFTIKNVGGIWQKKRVKNETIIW